jgi:hypothetical protein
VAHERRFRITSSNASSGSSTTPPGRYASAALVKLTCIPSSRPNSSTARLTIEMTAESRDDNDLVQQSRHD